EDAAAATDIERTLAREPTHEALDMPEAQRVDFVQRTELARRIPPAMRERAEFRQFGGIRVLVRLCRHAITRRCHHAALSSRSCSSMPCNRRSASRGRPATQT